MTTEETIGSPARRRGRGTRIALVAGGVLLALAGFVAALPTLVSMGMFRGTVIGYATDAVNGEAFNVGGDEHIAHRDLVKMLVEIAGQGSYAFVDWPAEKKAIDIGSFYADSSLFKSRTGWYPHVSLRDGFVRTFDFYRKTLSHYVGDSPV